MKLPPHQHKLNPRHRSLISSVFFQFLVLGCAVCVTISVLIFLTPLLVSSNFAFAQVGGIDVGETGTTNPKDREIQVTGTVTEFGTLEAVDLIDPPDNRHSRNNRPTFIWQDNATNSLATEYLFYLNDLHLYSISAGSSQTTTDYELYFDGGNQYSLKVFDGLADGTYTWKIVSKDANGATISSVTWTFTIDTRRPDFEINRINNQRVLIKTGDDSTIPTEPVEITSTRLELKGQSSYQDYVEVTVTFLNGSTRSDSFTVAEDGNWNRFFYHLPRNEVIYFDFLIYDVLGNESRLNHLPIIVVSPTITIPIPGIFVPPAIIPTEPPELVIPITPPAEIVMATIISIVSRIPVEITAPIVQQATYLNATLRTITPSFWATIDHWLAEWSVLLLLSLLVVAQITGLALVWRKYLNHGLFSSILQVIGIFPDGRHQGIAIVHPTQQPISYGLITLSGQKSNHQQWTAHRITNKQGLFFDIPAPEGKFQVSLQHAGYLFPCLEKKPAHFNRGDIGQYYTGQEINVGPDQPLPMLNIFATLKHVQQKGLTSFASKIANIPKLSWPIGLVALLITALLPTFGNLVTLAIFTLGWGWKTWENRRVGLTGDIMTVDQQPIANTIISLSTETDANQPGLPLEIVQSDPHGRYILHTKLNTYHLQVTHLHFKVAHKNKQQALTAVVTANDHYHPIVMNSINNS